MMAPMPMLRAAVENFCRPRTLPCHITLSPLLVVLVPTILSPGLLTVTYYSLGDCTMQFSGVSIVAYFFWLWVRSMVYV